jgi:transcription elongation factor Elf1
VYKLGTNPRKSGREQQYRCKKCGHIYTKSSIETKEKRTKYPNCPQCNSDVVRCGFWKWKENEVQRYQCKKCGHYFRIKKKNDRFEIIEKIKDYSWEGRSLRSVGSSLSSKLTASGFQKKLMSYSKRFKRINIFEIFNIPAPEVVCMDEFQGSWLGKDAIYWLAKDPFTAVGVAWLLTTGHSFLEAISLESKVTQNLRSNPKIWIHDGRIDYHSGLISKYSEEIVRRVYLNRKFKGSGSKIVDENTYLIQKQDEHLGG